MDTFLQHRLEKAYMVLSKVKRVAYANWEEGYGMADENEEVPAQREYFLIVETPDGEQCAASIYAVGLKVLSYHPYKAADACANCDLIDIGRDDADELSRLLAIVLLKEDFEVKPATKEDMEICSDPDFTVCPACNTNPLLGPLFTESMLN